MSFCVKCQGPANLVCSRCFDPYCGPTCQIRDWLVHKKNCKPMPDLIPIDLLNCDIKAPPNKETSYKQNPPRSPTVTENNESPIINITKKGNFQDSERSLKASRSTDAKLSISPKTASKQEVKENSKQSRFSLNDIEFIPIREGSNISLVVTDTSILKKFFISAYDSENKARNEMVKNLQKLEEYCTMAERNKRGYDPQFNEMCLAVFDEDGNWYRAFAIKENPSDDTYAVQFVDYGNITKVTRNDIMPIPKDLMFPTCTNLCRIVNIKENDLPRLKKYIDDNTMIKCDVNYNQNLDVYEVTVVNFEKALK